MAKISKKAVKKSVVAKKISRVKVKVEKTVESILLQPPRGMKDVLPREQPYWDQVRRVTEKLARDYGFSRIDLPLVEFSNLYTRSIGEGTDVVDKEMYNFTTRGGDKVALRPELTAGLCRSYIQNGMNVLSKPVKLFSAAGPVYRYDRPQEGRYREHYQVNYDAFGEQDPILDAQVIQIAHRLIQNLGIKSVQIQVNSIGCPVCRKDYRELLISYLESKKNKLCQDCKRRMETNPLRVLDCKEEKCSQVSASAPQSIDHLCAECRVHFKTLLEYLDELELPYIINPHLVRGLDYYTKTVFEIVSAAEGSRGSLGGGGRYDKLIKMLGGEETPAIGFAVGVERLVLEMKRVQAKPYRPMKPRVFLAQLGNLAKKKSLRLFSELEKNGILVAESFGRGSLRSQLKVADRLEVEFTLILGQKEALDATVIVKNMQTGVQETVSVDKLVEHIKKKLKTDNVVVYHS